MLKYSEAFTTYSTNDIKVTEKFYRDTLGLKISKNKMGLLELALTNCLVLIYPKQEHKSADFTVLNFYVSSIDDEVDSLSKKGVQFEKYGGEIKTDSRGIHRAEMGPSIAWFKDPAGNILSLIQEEK